MKRTLNWTLESIEWRGGLLSEDAQTAALDLVREAIEAMDCDQYDLLVAEQEANQGGPLGEALEEIGYAFMEEMGFNPNKGYIIINFDRDLAKAKAEAKAAALEARANEKR